MHNLHLDTQTTAVLQIHGAALKSAVYRTGILLLATACLGQGGIMFKRNWRNYSQYLSLCHSQILCHQGTSTSHYGSMVQLREIEFSDGTLHCPP